MKYRYTILYVSDVAKTLAFYEKAFGFKTALLHEAGDYGELDTGATKLAFSSLSLMQELNKTPGNARKLNPVFEIAFETDDVQKALDKALSAGGVLEQEVTKMPWGQTLAYVKDINGFLVEICSPIS